MGLRKELLPALDPKTANEECKVTSRNAHCFAAGDFRYQNNKELLRISTDLYHISAGATSSPD